MLDSTDWIRLIGALPRRWNNLRKPADEGRLLEVEKGLGGRLPSSYRNFLLANDGGYLGAARILGTVELGTGAVRELPEGLVPFHPVGGGFECLDVRPGVGGSAWVDAPVVWWDPDHEAVAECTYTDFTDWLLDHLQDAVGV